MRRGIEIIKIFVYSYYQFIYGGKRMYSRRSFIYGLSVLGVGVISSHARSIVTRQAKVNVDWKGFIETVKEKYPCILLLQFDFSHHDSFLKLQETKNRGLLTLFSYVPAIVMEKEQIKELFKVEDDVNNIFLISTDSKVLKKGGMDYQEFSESDKALKSIEKFIFENGELSKAWEKFSADANPEKVSANFKIIEGGSFKERKKAITELKTMVKANIKQIYEKSLNSEVLELKESCKDLLIDYRAKLPLISGVPAKQDRGDYYYHVEQW